MSETKERIRRVAEKLFFEEGIGNVRLQQIADETGISVGNLAYHFKNKDALVQVVYDKLFEDFSKILSNYLQLPDLRDFDQLFELLYHFYTKHSFYINNIWEIERSYPDIKKSWSGFNQKIILQIEKRIEYNFQRGVLLSEPYQGTYHHLAESIWININCWIPQQFLQGKKTTLNLYLRAIWNLLIPYLTPKGRMEYETKVPSALQS
jgi:AcrR family transcriptional regulator